MITCIDDDKVKFITLLLTIHYFNILFLMTRDEKLHTNLKIKFTTITKNNYNQTNFEIETNTKK